MLLACRRRFLRRDRAVFRLVPAEAAGAMAAGAADTGWVLVDVLGCEFGSGSARTGTTDDGDTGEFGETTEPSTSLASVDGATECDLGSLMEDSLWPVARLTNGANHPR